MLRFLLSKKQPRRSRLPVATNLYARFLCTSSDADDDPDPLPPRQMTFPARSDTPQEKTPAPTPAPILTSKRADNEKGNRDLYVTEIIRFMHEFRARAHYVALLDPLRGISFKKQAKDPWRTRNAADYARLLRNYPESIDWAAVGLQHVPPDEKFYVGHSVTKPAVFRASVEIYDDEDSDRDRRTVSAQQTPSLPARRPGGPNQQNP